MATKKLGTTLQALNAQIAALQAKADEIRKKEVGEVVAKIKDAIAHYGLTAADLGLGSSAPKAAKVPGAARPGRKPGRKAAGKAKNPTQTRAAKYTDGQGRTWGGIGKRPDWFKAALAAGKTPEDLLIKS
jgi:DNA-binding protein H-NS